MNTPNFWTSHGALSTLLLPLSWMYGGLRAWDVARVKTPVNVGVPVLCIGNITAGGSGKTPVALDIGKRLRARGVNAYFLTRGYKGAERGPLLVNPKEHTAREVGDEALLLASVLPTLVAKDRVAGAHAAVQHGARAIIIDDGFQHAALAKTLSLLVINGRYGFGNGRLLPAGPLREPIAAGLSRADGVILMGPRTAALDLPEDKPILSAETRPLPNIQSLAGKNFLAFCGIAHPDRFFSMLLEKGLILTGARRFADHHFYRESELKTLAADAARAGARLITTAKDAARLSPRWRSEILVAETELIWSTPHEIEALLDRSLGNSS